METNVVELQGKFLSNYVEFLDSKRLELDATMKQFITIAENLSEMSEKYKMYNLVMYAGNVSSDISDILICINNYDDNEY
jgi:hypothetical protein